MTYPKWLQDLRDKRGKKKGKAPYMYLKRFIVMYVASQWVLYDRYKKKALPNMPSDKKELEEICKEMNSNYKEHIEHAS